jgi:hypothetical protein
MADLIHEKSPNELGKEILALVAGDLRALPIRSKIFAAVAKLQGFDTLPEIGTLVEIETIISEGGIEIQRGLSATKGIPSTLYAKELAVGPLFPGTQSAKGNGIYFAVPSLPDKFKSIPSFLKVSQVALKHTFGESSGIIVKAVLKPGAKTADFDEVKQLLREHKNRAKTAGIEEIGSFCAALGFDAVYCDEVYEGDLNERVYVVFNRGALVLQNICLMIPPK